MDRPRIKFPYGISNFAQLTKNNYVFVDKTKYIEQLEEEERYVIFLRPRRFGKSLFVSILEYYYDILEKNNFQGIFSKYYIGKNPTSLANQYRVLKFDFSGIDTQTEEHTYKYFLSKLKHTLKNFMYRYNLFCADIVESILLSSSPANLMDNFFEYYDAWQKQNNDSTPIYVIIDEYDHFTNEILVRDLAEFKRSVSQNGYVRKFYETLKIATQQGIVDRFFITGVSPMTMDSLTSGFNIGKHLSNNEVFHDMLGFVEDEVKDFLELVLIDNNQKDRIMNDLRKWYNGYKFNPEITHTLYNPDMVLYFLDAFKYKQSYPREMLDPNIMPDYGKLMKLFEVANYAENIEVLQEVLENDKISCPLLYQFLFEKPFDRTAFINFLYYLGNLTLSGIDAQTGYPNFMIPNFVIGRLFWQYYALVMQEKAILKYDTNSIEKSVEACAYGNIELFFKEIQRILENLSNRDYQRFDEKYIKALMMAYLHHASFYYIRSEREVKNEGYLDLEVLKRSDLSAEPYQYVLEIKYLKQSEESRLSKIMELAKNQLKKYLTVDAELKTLQKLKSIAVVIVKDKIYWEEV